MNLQDNTIIEVELKRLLQFLDDRDNLSAEARLQLLREEMRVTIEAAKTGWL